MKRVLCVFELNNNTNAANCNFLTNLSEENLMDENIIKELEIKILEVYPNFKSALLVNLCIIGEVI